MGLLKKINFSLYRDADFEAFYDVDEKYRRRIIIGHMMIHLLPLLIFVMVYWYNPENRYTIYLVIASLLFLRDCRGRSSRLSLSCFKENI